MTNEQLETIIRNAITLGHIHAMEYYVPEGKWMSRPQVISLLKAHGYKASTLKDWEANRVLAGVQTGAGGTHKYRKLDVQKALLKMAMAT